MLLIWDSKCSKSSKKSKLKSISQTSIWGSASTPYFSLKKGNLYGGVIGTDIVRYDVFGEDVLIANQMESKGEKGRMQVSEITKNLIEGSFPEEF